MIEKNEILKMATGLGLRPDTVEKDYVLGWMLWGINQHPVISSWAFKGGTGSISTHADPQSRLGVGQHCGIDADAHHFKRHK